MSLRWRVDPDGRLDIINFAILRHSHAHPKLFMNFKDTTTNLREFIEEQRNHITFISPAYNYFFDVMYEFNGAPSVQDSPFYPIRKNAIENAFYDIFRDGTDPKFRSIFLPQTKINRNDLPACGPIKSKFVLISMTECGHELVMFNLLASFVHHQVLISLAGNIEREVPACNHENIVKRIRLFICIKITMVRHFAYRWFDRQQSGGGVVTKKYFFDELLEADILAKKEIEQVRKGYATIDATLQVLCGEWLSVKFYGSVNFNEEYFENVFREACCSEYSW